MFAFFNSLLERTTTHPPDVGPVQGIRLLRLGLSNEESTQRRRETKVAETYKAVEVAAPGGLRVVERPTPQPGEG